jgi:hypothetical protein
MKTELKIDYFGNKLWYKEGTMILHREDGPAIEYFEGSKEWYLNGKLHREDGPAIEDSDGRKYWYLNGKLLDCKTQEEFERLIRLKAFW